VLYPVTGALLSPMIAAAAMALSSISVVLNAARLNGFTSPALPRTADGEPSGPAVRDAAPQPPETLRVQADAPASPSTRQEGSSR
jgi:Cu+-exporting ATPase